MSLTVPGRSRRLALALMAWARGRLAMMGLLPVGDQPADDRLNAAVSEVLGLFSGHTGEWMFDHDHGVVR